MQNPLNSSRVLSRQKKAKKRSNETPATACSEGPATAASHYMALACCQVHMTRNMRGSAGLRPLGMPADAISSCTAGWSATVGRMAGCRQQAGTKEPIESGERNIALTQAHHRGPVEHPLQLGDAWQCMHLPTCLLIGQPAHASQCLVRRQRAKASQLCQPRGLHSYLGERTRHGSPCNSANQQACRPRMPLL